MCMWPFGPLKSILGRLRYPDCAEKKEAPALPELLGGSCGSTLGPGCPR